MNEDELELLGMEEEDDDMEEIETGMDDDLEGIDGEDIIDGIGEEIEDSFEEDSLTVTNDEPSEIMFDRPLEKDAEEEGKGQEKVIQGAACNLMRSTIESFCQR